MAQVRGASLGGRPDLAQATGPLNLVQARSFVLEMCRAANVDRPPPEALEHVAAELVRVSIEACDKR